MTTLIESTKRDRAYVEESQIEEYRRLAGLREGSRKVTSGDQLSPFKSLKDVFLLAACIGLKIRRRTALKKREEIFFTSYLQNIPDLAVVRAIAIAETGDVRVLASLNDVMTIAEEYATTGFEEMRHSLTRPGVPLENLVELLLEQ